MSWRTVIISSQSKLDYQMGYMVIRGLETQKILLNEVAILMIENPAVSFTGCLIAELIEKKVKVVFCDEKRSPAAELVPYHGSHDSATKIRSQITWSEETKAMVWQEIVSEKIRNQAELLYEVHKKQEGDLIASYIDQVERYDATNREGHAAKVYFNALFGMEFSRGADNPINAALNYGYSLLLSAFNREVAANGYLTQLGIFHDNMFNHFNLSCDLMEPFRILVDRKVFYERPSVFEKEQKHAFWRLLEETVLIDGTKQMVSNAIKIYAKSVFDAMNDGDVFKLKFYKSV